MYKLLEWDGTLLTDKVVSQIVFQVFSSGIGSSMVVNSQISEFARILLPQPWADVALVIFWSIQIDVLEIREVLPHEVV